MHYGEIEHRSIYGEASPEEAKDLPRKASNSIRCRCCRTSGISAVGAIRPHQQRDADRPPARFRSISRRVVGCLKMKRVTPCANSTSTSASVRTFAAVAMAKARNQNSEANAPMKPANSDGRHACTMARKHLRIAQRKIGVSSAGLHHQPDRRRVKVAARTKSGRPSDRIAPR